MGLSRLEVMKVIPKDATVLSGYTHSRHYCSYLKKHGRNSVEFLEQVNQMVKNLMSLLVLVEMIKGNKMHSKTKSFIYKRKSFYEGSRQTCNGFSTKQALPQHATATQYTKEDFNLTPLQTCLIGNTVALAGEGNSKKGYSFAIYLDKDTVELGLENCCTNHVCFEKKLFTKMKDTSPIRA
eukprot:7683456-Ditylum_brightwellii.AAC.1